MPCSLVKVKLCLGRAHRPHLQGQNACYTLCVYHCENLKANTTLYVSISIVLNKYVIKINLLRISLLLGHEYTDKHDFPNDGWQQYIKINGRQEISGSYKGWRNFSCTKAHTNTSKREINKVKINFQWRLHYLGSG
jgi:hypothetical protein